MENISSSCVLLRRRECRERSRSFAEKTRRADPARTLQNLPPQERCLTACRTLGSRSSLFHPSRVSNLHNEGSPCLVAPPPADGRSKVQVHISKQCWPSVLQPCAKQLRSPGPCWQSHKSSKHTAVDSAALHAAEPPRYLNQKTFIHSNGGCGAYIIKRRMRCMSPARCPREVNTRKMI